MRGVIVLTTASLLCLAGSSWATVIELDMNSLPSAQGWTYETGTAVPENVIFSVNGTHLNMNSMGQGSARFAYELDSGIDFTRPYEVRMTARVNEAEGDTAHYLYSQTDDGRVVIITYPDRIDAVSLGTIYTGDMMGAFYDYRLVVNPGSGFSFYLDNSFIYSGPFYYKSSASHLGFGDGSGHPNTNANVDFAALRIFQPPIPEPSTFLIWSLGLIGLAWYARRRRTK